MGFTYQDKLKKLSDLDKKPKKTGTDLTEMKETVAAILAQDKEWDSLLENLPNRQWNPKTLELLSEGLRERLRDTPEDKTVKDILAILRANHKGVWLPGMVKVLSALLAHNEVNALEFFREILTKARKSGERDAWDFFEKYFMNYLKPNQGLPYILALFLESWPKKPPSQIEAILNKLADRYSKESNPSFPTQTRTAFGKYLAQRCTQLDQPFEEVEGKLLKLVAMQRMPEWQEQLSQVTERLREAQSEGEIKWASIILKELASQVRDQKADQIESHFSPEFLEKSIPSPIEAILAKKKVFLIEFDSFIRRYEELQTSHSQTARLLEETKTELTHLKDLVRSKDQTIAKHSSSINLLRQERDNFSRENVELQTKMADLENKIQEEQIRSDVRAHQINIEAERKILEFKVSLWRRLSPDLEDLINNDLKEEDYATPERGRRLYRRIMDLIRILKESEVIPTSKTTQGA